MLREDLKFYWLDTQLENELGVQVIMVIVRVKECVYGCSE